MSAIASQITSLTIVYSTVYLGADQSKHQSSASLAFVWGIHRGPGNSPHKWPVTRIMFPFDDVTMTSESLNLTRRIVNTIINVLPYTLFEQFCIVFIFMLAVCSNRDLPIFQASAIVFLIFG